MDIKQVQENMMQCCWNEIIVVNFNSGSKLIQYCYEINTEICDLTGKRFCKEHMDENKENLYKLYLKMKKYYEN